MWRGNGNGVRGAALLALLALGAAGCDDGNRFPDSPVAPGNDGEAGFGSIGGQVTAGSGVGGAQLTIIDGDSTRTDAQGAYLFSAVRSGRYRLSVGVPPGFNVAPGDSATKTATVTAGERTNVDFLLVRTGQGL